MDDAVTAGWWRRNAVALGALVVLIPVGAWAFDTIEFGAVRNAQRSVPLGTETAIGDWTFAPPEITSVSPGDVGAPSGTDPVVVRIAVTPGDDEVACSAPLLIDPETGREWWPARDLGWSSADDERNSCPPPVDDDGLSASAFDLTALVLLPADAPDRLIVGFGGNLSADDLITDVRVDATR